MGWWLEPAEVAATARSCSSSSQATVGETEEEEKKDLALARFLFDLS